MEEPKVIIKFDHVSFVCARSDKNKVLMNKGEPSFKEIGLKNLKIKKSLMHMAQQDHDLYFFEDGYPTEYIFYDAVNSQSRIELVDNVLYGKYMNKQKAIDFLKGIFGEKVTEEGDNIVCNMRGIIDKNDYMLILEKTTESIIPWLDDSGYGIVTLVNNVRFTKKPVDGICTDYEVFKVNGKELEICFTKSNSTNIIFEIIKVR